MAPLLPGFDNAVHDAQQTFRSLLFALAEPGRIQSLNLLLDCPVGLELAIAAASLTLLDLETQLWISPSGSEDLRRWLQFHTGCRFAKQPEQADFALVLDTTELPGFSRFRWGTAEEPEQSTTLLLQVEALGQAGDQAGGPVADQLGSKVAQSVTLRGPGILEQRLINPALPESFWGDWQQNQGSYPLGVDVYLFCGAELMGLPRSVKAVAESSLERSPCLT